MSKVKKETVKINLKKEVYISETSFIVIISKCTSGILKKHQTLVF